MARWDLAGSSGAWACATSEVRWLTSGGGSSAFAGLLVSVNTDHVPAAVTTFWCLPSPHSVTPRHPLPACHQPTRRRPHRRFLSEIVLVHQLSLRGQSGPGSI